jgi:integrase/recombinase XerD
LRPLLLTLGINLRIRYKRHKKLPKYHTIDQVKAVLSEANKRSDNWQHLAERDWLLIALLAYTGIRRSEVLAIKRSDVDLVNNMLTVHGKGDNQRTIPLSSQLREPLAKHLDGFHHQDKIFPMKPRRLWTIITNYAHSAGIYDLHPHSFRHFFATQLVERGVSLNVIKELLGHADIGSTAIYLDALPLHLRSAISALPDLGK